MTKVPTRRELVCREIVEARLNGDMEEVDKLLDELFDMGVKKTRIEEVRK